VEINKRGVRIMIIKLVRQMKGSELVEMLKEKYGSMDNLKRVMEKKRPEKCFIHWI
jgi:hypothetical protein